MTDPVDTDMLRRDAQVLSPGFPGVEKRLHAAADEVGRLRAVIDNAPHTDDCLGGTSNRYTQGQLPCDCWKADAL